MKNNKMMMLLATLGSSLCLASCLSTNNTDSSKDANISESITEIASKAEVSYQLITSSAFLSTPKSAMNAKLKKALGKATETTDNASITSLLGQIDVFVSTTEDKIKIESKTSDRAEYTSLDVVSYTDIANKQTSMSLYYNSFAEQNIDDDDDDHDEKETEVKTRLEGIVVTSNQENAFIALKEEETDVDEEESEISTKIFTSADKTSYILASKTFETEKEMGNTETEISYEYTIVTDGVKKETFSYEYEIENGKEEVELKYGTSNFFIKMETENNKTIFKVVDKSTNTTTRYIKTILDDGSVTYTEVNK